MHLHRLLPIVAVTAFAQVGHAEDFEIEAFAHDRGGWRTASHVRELADVNGDGRDDIVGFGHGGVRVALSTGTGFGPSEVWLHHLCVAQGWGVAHHERRVADVNGDGRADLVAFGHGGTWVALSDDDGHFEPIQMWSTQFGYAHWRKSEGDVRIMGDINGDGRADIVAFGNGGTWVSYSDGASFSPRVRVLTRFANDAGHWTLDHPRRLADVDGDGDDDLIAFGETQVFVMYATGNPQTPFVEGAPAFSSRQLTRSRGWRSDEKLRELADVNGDGMADIVTFDDVAVRVYLSQGDDFIDTGAVWFRGDMVDGSNNWSIAHTPRRLGDIDGDGRADLVGFHYDRTYARVSDGQRFLRASQPYAPLGTAMMTTLSPMHNNHCMHAEASVGTAITQRSCNVSKVRKVNFTLKGRSDGTAEISVLDQYCVRPNTPLLANNSELRLRACTDDVSTQRWLVRRALDGSATLHPADNVDLCVAVPNMTNSGVNLRLEHCSYRAHQIWRMETLHPKVVRGKLRHNDGSCYLGRCEPFDIIDSGRGQHILRYTNNRCVTHSSTNCFLTCNTAPLRTCNGSQSQLFNLHTLDGRMAVETTTQPGLFLAYGNPHSYFVWPEDDLKLRIEQVRADTQAALKLHRVPTSAGLKTVLTIDGPHARHIVEDPQGIAHMLAENGVVLTVDQEEAFFGAPLAQTVGDALSFTVFSESKGDGVAGWSVQPVMLPNGDWGPVSGEVTLVTHDFTADVGLDGIDVDIGLAAAEVGVEIGPGQIEASLMEFDVQTSVSGSGAGANVGYSVISVEGTVGDEDGTHAGVGFGTGPGIEAAASWGEDGQYGVTIGVKFVTIQLYVSEADAVKVITQMTSGINTGMAEVGRGIYWIRKNIGGAFADAGGYIVNAAQDVANALGNAAGSAANSVKKAFCGIFGC